MNIENLGLNPEEENTSGGSGQPQEQNPGEEQKQTDTASSEEQNVPKTPEDEKVVLSKEEYQKLTRDKENYKKGLLSEKQKTKEQPKEEKTIGGDPLTKQDFHKINEQKAIAKFIKDNPQVEGEWPKFVSFYRDIRGKNDSESIYQDLDDALTIYQKHNPKEAKEDDKQTRSDLSSESSLSSSPQKDSGEKPQKKSIIPKKSRPSEWYKTE